MDVTIKEVPGQQVIAIRFQTSVDRIPDEIGARFGALFGYLGELGAAPAGMPVALYYGGKDFDPQAFEMELCVPVASLPASRGEIVARELPGGRMATTIHQGPYESLESTYSAMEAWLAEHGHEMPSVQREIYLNDPSTVPPSGLLTEVQYPLAA